jgi:hypothetical protein
MENTYYYAPVNFTNDEVNENTINTNEVMNSINSGIMIDENTQLVNIGNPHNDLLIIKQDILKYIKNQNSFLDNELDISIEPPEPPSTSILVDALRDFMNQFKEKTKDVIDNEKLLKSEVDKCKDDINILNGMISKTKNLMEKYDLNKNAIELMSEMGESIREKNNIKKAKEKYIKSRNDLGIYLETIKSINSLNLGNTCSLCLSNNVDVYFQNCGHTSCQDCADRIVEYDGGIENARCSFCRKDIFKINKLYYI